MWKLILVITAIILYFIYNIAVLILFKTPFSLSETYYLFSNYNPKLKILFPSIMIGIASLLLPAWLELSEGNNFQFTAFLACSGLIFTGMVPTFKKGNFENIIHTGSAYFAVVTSFIWIFALTNLWYVILIYGFVIGIIGWLCKLWKTSYIYLLENIAILATLTNILLTVL